MNELRWVGSNSDRALMLGFVPKISIDLRIRCPREFTSEFPPPPRPTIQYYDVAAKVAEKAVTAMWQYRPFIEVIKVGFRLGESSPDELYIVCEAVLAIPSSNQKVSVAAEKWISSANSKQGMGLRFASEAAYEPICRDLAELLIHRVRLEMRRHTSDIEQAMEQLQRFQETFE